MAKDIGPAAAQGAIGPATASKKSNALLWVLVGFILAGKGRRR